MGALINAYIAPSVVISGFDAEDITSEIHMFKNTTPGHGNWDLLDDEGYAFTFYSERMGARQLILTNREIAALKTLLDRYEGIVGRVQLDERYNSLADDIDDEEMKL